MVYKPNISQRLVSQAALSFIFYDITTIFYLRIHTILFNLILTILLVFTTFLSYMARLVRTRKLQEIKLRAQPLTA